MNAGKRRIGTAFAIEKRNFFDARGEICYNIEVPRLFGPTRI